MPCLFCEIVNKKRAANIVYENDNFIAFEDIEPKAPLHLLVIPKKHIPTVDHLGPEEGELMRELFLIAQKIAREQGVSKSGYRLIINVGKDAGQTVEHLHLHILGGRKLSWT